MITRLTLKAPQNSFLRYFKLLTLLKRLKIVRIDNAHLFVT